MNRDELAAALRSRLAELQIYPNAWRPEILSLLVQLSDRPTQLAKFDPSTRPFGTDQVPEQTLSWADLDARGAAFSDEDIWQEVDFGPGSSDDEFGSVTSDVSLTRGTPLTSLDPEEEYVIPDEAFMSGEDEDLIASMKNAQFWRLGNTDPVPQGKVEAPRLITELQLARETIFMLQGLPTSIFWRVDNDIEVDRNYTLTHSSYAALSSLLKLFTEIGSKIDALRRFTEAPLSIAYMQTFCRGIEGRLHDFDGFLSRIQRGYLSAGSTVSLLQLGEDVRQSSRQLLLLSDLVSELAATPTDQPMRCLDLLYNLVCMTEALGDEETSRALATLFFSCFKTYTRSIQLWMESGQIHTLDTAFFVKLKSDNGDLRTLWHEWYEIEVHRQNIPQFLEPSLYKVFTTGKSMVFLRHLNAPPDRSESVAKAHAIFDDVYSEASSMALPFPALVESAFHRLVDAHHSTSAALLRTELDEQCGLWASFEALHHVYLGQDVSILSIIDTKIFELMDRGRSWDDKFLLTEVTRSAFSAIPTMDLSRLVIRSANSSSHDNQNLTRTVKILEVISIDYVLPWPVANIVTQDAIHTYRRVSTFLMQIRRAKYALVKQRLRDGRNIAAGGRDEALVRSLHHNLLWFLDTLYTHLTHLVISIANRSFHQALTNAEDVDAMITTHDFYMSSLESQCLLSENLSPIHEAIVNLLDLSIHFADLQTVHAAEEGMFDLGDASMLNTLRRKKRDSSDLDSDEEDDFEHEQTLTISFRNSPYDLQMRNVKRQFEHLINFVSDGLKGVARADGLPSWNILAERLEWRKG